MNDPGSPTQQPPTTQPSRRERTFGVAALLLAAVVGGLATRCLSSEPEATPPQTVQIVRPTPDVITAVRALARLETANYHVERVIDLRDQQNVLFGVTTAHDAILVVAAGDVVVGVDLAKIRPEDIVVDEARRSVRIVLPAPEVFSARLDNDRTFVYERRTDVLARRSETLETRARQEAERTMRASAVESGALVRAGLEAKTTVTSLLRGLGFESVQVELVTDEGR